MSEQDEVLRDKEVKLFVVVTTMDDNMADVILITPSEKKAIEITEKITNREPIEGFDYDLLAEYDDAQYFTRTMGSLKNWESDS